MKNTITFNEYNKVISAFKEAKIEVKNIVLQEAKNKVSIVCEMPKLSGKYGVASVIGRGMAYLWRFDTCKEVAKSMFQVDKCDIQLV